MLSQICDEWSAKPPNTTWVGYFVTAFITYIVRIVVIVTGKGYL